MTDTLFGDPPRTFLLAGNAIVEHQPRWLDVATASNAFQRVRAEAPWRHEHIMLYGRRIPLPRLTAWHGDAGACYVYSGVRNEPAPWTDTLDRIRQSVSMATGARFNSVLLNMYRSGDDHVGLHADDEPELGRDPVIASISLGASRRFIMRHVTEPPVEFTLEHGDLLVMRGGCQRWWKHGVPRQRGAAERINMTFRLVKNEAT